MAVRATTTSVNASATMSDQTPPVPGEGQVFAPFTPDQVESLNACQRLSGLHPFTCPHDRAMLAAQSTGWVCTMERCTFTQNWAWSYMADGTWRCDEPLFAGRPLDRYPVPEGWERVAELADGWRVPARRRLCRRHENKALCSRTAIAEQNRSRPGAPERWVAYCRDHARGHWIENGQVMRWGMRRKAVAAVQLPPLPGEAVTDAIQVVLTLYPDAQADAPELERDVRAILEAGQRAIREDERQHLNVPRVYCRGCGQSWPDGECACTCKEGDPHYEDWVTGLGPGDFYLAGVESEHRRCIDLAGSAHATYPCPGAGGMPFTSTRPFADLIRESARS